MIDPEIVQQILALVQAVEQVGIREVWISIEADLVSCLELALQDQNWLIGQEQWQPAEDLYIGQGSPQLPLTVLSLKF
jgi:hypothetical protein